MTRHRARSVNGGRAPMVRRLRMVRMQTEAAAIAALVALTAGGLALAQEDTTAVPAGADRARSLEEATHRADPERIRAAWERFEAAGEGRWRVTWDDRTGLPRMISGGTSAAYPGTPLEAARAFLDDHRVLYGLDDDRYALRHFQTKLTKLGPRVTFIQEYRGLEVVHGRLLVLLDGQGRVRHTATTVWPVGEVAVTPTLPAGRARRLVERELAAGIDARWLPPTPAIYPRAEGRLAYLVGQRLGDVDLPWEYAIDAHTGELLERRQVIDDLDHERHGGPAPDAITPPERRSRGPVAAPPPPGPAPDPCDRQWNLTGPAGETTVTETGMPMDPFEVQITVGNSAFGIAEDGGQTEANYGAGMALLPCIEYTITFDWNHFTWDSYSSFDGFWDVFLVHVNSVAFYWDIIFPNPIADHVCDAQFNPVGFIDLPGPLWTMGGLDWGNGVLCASAGGFFFIYEETDSSLNVFLSVGLDTGITGDVDGLYPSWGTYDVEITGETKAFDPNPVTTLNDNTLTDMGDANSAVPCTAYIDVTLTNLETPAAGQPWKLEGDYCKIADLAAPAGTTSIPFMPPESRDMDFPYIRDCDAFEAVNIYHHLTQNQIYIQSLGFIAANNRAVEVDAHGISQDNSFHVPDGTGMGYLIFGDGGVDDAEDADVVIHEYGHGLQDNMNVGAFAGGTDNGFGNETKALGEAFGDYWACSTFNAQNVASGFDPALFAEWDAPPNGLRNLANSKVYPTDMGASFHLNGEIWSGAMWDIFQALGKAVTDTLVMDANILIPMMPDFNDNADAVITADFIESGGANAPFIADVFVNRGIYRRLTVKSIRTGAAVDLDTADVLGDEDGNARFIRRYNYGRMVMATAPAMHGGEVFNRWRIDGVAQGAGVNPITVTMSQSHTITAIFGATISGDTNGDFMVNGVDLVNALLDWGTNGAGNGGDVNNDGVVDGQDVVLIILNWGL